MVVPICEVMDFEVEPWSGFFSVCLREGRTSCSAIDMVEEDELKITGGRREIGCCSSSDRSLHRPIGASYMGNR